jgi:CheY-like chemotaxis protein
MTRKDRIYPCIRQGSGNDLVARPSERGIYAASPNEFSAGSNFKRTRHPICAVKRHKCRAPIALLLLSLVATPAAFAKKPFFPDRPAKSEATKPGPAAAETTNAEIAVTSEAGAQTNEPALAAESSVSPSELSGPESAFANNRVYAAPAPPEEVKPLASRNDYLLATAVFLAVAFGVTRLLQRCSKFDPWNPQQDPLIALFQRACPTFAGFFGALNAEEDATEKPTLSPGGSRAQVLELDVVASALAILTGLRARLLEASETFADSSRLQLLQQIRKELASINPGGDSTGLQPIWLLVSALDGLLAEVSGNTSHMTPSVLRTITSGLDVIEGLCVAALDIKLNVDQPVRLLAVDDDPISQRALTFALKKVFPAPEIVPTGEAALALAARNSYDLIFLDLELPGIDGFEVCTRLRQLPANQSTPVVFVTSHGNFNSRAESVLRGAEDLIGKPFLTYEIALKAVTVVLRNRYQANLSPLAPASSSGETEHLSATLSTRSAVLA